MNATLMPLTQNAINELKAIYRRECGADLSDDDAWGLGNRLLRVYAVLMRPPERRPTSDKVRPASRLT